MLIPIPPFKPKLPEIAESEQPPWVRSLLQVIADLQAQVQRLEDELRRLQGGSPRPGLKPNTLEPAGPVVGDLPRRRGPQRAKTAELKIDATERVPLADVPDGAEFKGYRRFVIPDLAIRPHHQGQNGDCLSIGERFAWLASTDSGSRINFWELLQVERCYEVNAAALVYMAERDLAEWPRRF